MWRAPMPNRSSGAGHAEEFGAAKEGRVPDVSGVGASVETPVIPVLAVASQAFSSQHINRKRKRECDGNNKVP